MSGIPTRPPLAPRFARRFFLWARRGDIVGAGTHLLLFWVLTLAACGQVVTAEAPTAIPTDHPTPALSLSTISALPTVTRSLPTAAPPDTPSPSPTPIYHAIKPGETLIAIALQYGVTVGALQSANGITDPSTLQVGQELIIPTGEESQGDSLDLLLPTPTPIAFSTEGLACHEQPAGSLWCMGEVVNSTESSIENVQLRVTLLNAAGEELAGGNVYTALDLIRSGQRAPFGILFSSPPDSFDSLLALPIRAEASSEPANRYAVLKVGEIEVNPVGSLFEVSGNITNPGQNVITSITVIVTTYNTEGHVTGFRQFRLPEGLPVGGNADFSISLMPYSGIPANYTVAVQGRLATQ